MTPRAAAYLGGALLVLGTLSLGLDRLGGGGGTPPGPVRGSLRSWAQVGTAIRQGQRHAAVDRHTKTITYRGGRALLVALASPHGQPTMTWEMDGLVNPTIVLPPGIRVTVDLVNTDWGYMHGFEVTATPPPYPYMPMMQVTDQVLLMPLPERTTKNLTTAQYYTSTGQFTLAPGTYYYLCPVPGHATQGMYGKIVVR